MASSWNGMMSHLPTLGLYLSLLVRAGDGGEDSALGLAALHGVQPGVGRHTPGLLPALGPHLRSGLERGERLQRLTLVYPVSHGSEVEPVHCPGLAASQVTLGQTWPVRPQVRVHLPLHLAPAQ